MIQATIKRGITAFSEVFLKHWALTLRIPWIPTPETQESVGFFGHQSLTSTNMHSIGLDASKESGT
jgi:hypothetical protein